MTAGAKEKSPARAGLEVWRSERGRREEQSETLRAALGGPGAGAVAASRRPGARAVGAGHAAGTGRALVALGNRDGDRAVRADLAGHIEGGGARIADRAVLDLDRIAVGAVAGALFGDDQDTPAAVEALRRGDRGRTSRDDGRGQDRARREGGGGADRLGEGHRKLRSFRISLSPELTHACFGRMVCLFVLCGRAIVW